MVSILKPFSLIKLLPPNSGKSMIVRIKILDSKSKIIHLDPLKEGDMTRRQPDVERMKSLLNRDFTPLEKGLKKII